MKITSVNLDDEAQEIAEHIPNLSSFVRESLKRWANQNRALAEHEHLHWRDRVDACWPFSPKGLCHTCWPEGPPAHGDWMRFSNSGNIHENPDRRFRDHEWIAERARKHTESTGFSMKQMHFNRFEKSDHDQQPRRGILARLRAILGR